jgi:hypothetical protein
MEIDFAAEWQRLTRHYAEMGDDELRELAGQFGDLTEMAQQVLRDEMRKRRLGDPGEHRKPESLREQTRRLRENRDAARKGLVPPPQWDTALALPAEENGAEEEEQGHEYTWKTLLCECDTREEAWQIYEVLRRAGIESWLEAPGRYSELNVNGPRVIVAADQLDQARQIASQPIPQDVIDDSKIRVPEFKSPHCPRCNAGDPVLESVDPSNAWSCECCGYEWAEPVRDLNGNGSMTAR